LSACLANRRGSILPETEEGKRRERRREGRKKISQVIRTCNPRLIGKIEVQGQPGHIV
jgi:hypothetical protein